VRETLGVSLGPWDAFLPTVEPTAGPVVVSEASGDYFSVYFTTPTEGVQTGGVDERLAEAIDAAQSTVDIAAFEFDLQSVANALIAAHQRGVRVRMVDDDEHTEDSEQMEQVRDAGIPVVDDQRSAYMHNKFIIIDGREVWTGSLNYTENGVYRNNNNLIRLTVPELVANYTTEFEEMFLEASFGPTSPLNTPYDHITTADGVRIENYFASEDDAIIEHIRAQVARAETSIHIMIFAFTEDSLGETVLERAASGVEVQGIFDSLGANTQYSLCPVMLNQGIDVRLDSNPKIFHHKVIIIDGSTVVTGSFNFTANAVESNDENLLIIHDPAVAELYEAEFAARWQEARLPVGGECLAE
jgi:phosphatidylserine/phosphatidylglycerophosphate/cardiolipin synthase-like enzyme